MTNPLLNQDLCGEISKYLTFDELLKTSLTCKDVYKNTQIDKLREIIKKTLGSQFDQKDNISTLKDKIKNHFLTLKEAISNFPKNEIPNDIQEILTKKTSLTNEEHNLLKEFSKARSTLVIWKKLGNLKLKDFSLPKNVFESANSVIDSAKNFDAWFKQNFRMLQTLPVIYAEKMQLTFIPPQIGKLTQLKSLSFQKNQLLEIPPEIGNIHKLETLYLEKNRLTKIPQNLENLNLLRYLHLEENNLNTISQKIANLPSIEGLYIKGNPLQDLPQEIKKFPKVRI